MRTILLLGALVLATGCYNWVEGAWDGKNDQVEVCTQGEAGRCCFVTIDICAITDPGCEPGGRFPRPPTRCNRCWPEEIDDGSPPPPLGTPPPNSQRDPGLWVDADGGVDDPRIEICGPATYEKYE